MFEVMKDLFHPTVANWFQNTFETPTEIQTRAWPEIKKKHNTLIAAPTGSGKTLAAFYSAIDDLVKLGLESQLANQLQVVYISPLKALGNDIERNLQFPLNGIKKELAKAKLPEVKIKVSVRTGDTPPSQRTAMAKNPPHILVTTPESLYLLLTSDSGRRMLETVHTVIVDEIHALVGDKRGSHLALSLERLDNITQQKLIRIGLSATQKPINKVANFLTGNDGHDSNTPPCSIIDAGHTRKLDLSLEVPRSPLTAIMPTEVWSEIYERLEELINSHETTLIFVNTRRLAERIAHNLTGRLGEKIITAHHGSMSKEHRLDAEQRLKAGSLKALVATASLELGIDIGSVDLVCHIGSSKSIAAFLQRVGRSGHSVHGTPKGRLFPLSRDELVECCAILDAVRRGELDQIIMPEKPLDILAQQIVAEISCQEYKEEELFQLFRNAYPYRDLTRKEFDDIVTMLSEGYATRKGRRSAYLHHDVVNERIRGRKNARLTSLICGGSIPDNFDYDVVMEPENTFVGTVNEDFVFESIPGDIFQLGNSAWRIMKVENGKVRVEDAKGMPPNIPFWFGEAPGRSMELSFAVSRLREEISHRLTDLESIILENNDKEINLENEVWKQTAVEWLIDEVGVAPEAADQVVTYLATAKLAFGIMPSQNTLVLERFFDEAGDMHLIIHSPFGSRLNRAWGLSLRKRFCRKFNFELQAAATEDSIILSLGATHSFPLQEVFDYLNPQTVREILIQALLDAPMFEVRWRWNASRALAILRRSGGKKVPAQIQRMHAEDLIALIFPDQLACLENIVGERDIPDHPLVRQTIHDCLTEAMDIDELENLLTAIHGKEKTLIVRDLKEPSPLAQEILNARPFAFLDNAPLEERRTNAVMNRRWLDPKEAADLGKLDIAAIEAVNEEAWPQVRNTDELHDALVLLGFLTEYEGTSNNWQDYFEQLVNENRAACLSTRDTGLKLWVAVERMLEMKEIYPDGNWTPDIQVPERLLLKLKENDENSPDQKDPLVEIIRGRLEALGPVTTDTLADHMRILASKIEQALLSLENDGFVFRGQFHPGFTGTEWCERRLLARIHRYTLERLRREIEPVSSADFMRFLFAWHHLDSENKPEGPEALEDVLTRLEGFEAAAASWESDILPARIKDYDYHWLDDLCLSGRVVWGRFQHTGNTLTQSENGANGKKRGGPVKTTPITMVSRSNLSVWKNLAVPPNVNNNLLSSNARKALEIVSDFGASFFDEIVEQSQLLQTQVEEAMSELVSLGLITSDSYTGLRALLVPVKSRSSTGLRRRSLAFKMEQAGRWSLLRYSTQKNEDNKLEFESIVMIAWTLLRRYGVVFRKIIERESFAPPWRELVRVFRTLEARGEIRGGRFVDGVWGEQYALPEAVTKLRNTRKAYLHNKENGENNNLISICAADPLNLTGIITVGKRVSNIYSNRILYKDGVPIAVKEGKAIKFLIDVDESEQWELKNVLIQRNVKPKLRAYLGKETSQVLKT